MDFMAGAILTEAKKEENATERKKINK